MFEFLRRLIMGIRTGSQIFIVWAHLVDRINFDRIVGAIIWCIIAHYAANFVTWIIAGAFEKERTDQS